MSNAADAFFAIFGMTRVDTSRLLVCGGREYRFGDVVAHYLDRLKPQVVIHGGATGADTLAAQWADRNGVETLVFHADWAREGRAAGPSRNARMLREGQPTCVLALPGGKGTADMVRRAKAAGVPVYEVE